MGNKQAAKAEYAKEITDVAVHEHAVVGERLSGFIGRAPNHAPIARKIVGKRQEAQRRGGGSPVSDPARLKSLRSAGSQTGAPMANNQIRLLEQNAE
jgi:hypothetical protein